MQPSESTIKQVGTKCRPLPAEGRRNFCRPSFHLGRHCRSSYCSRSALLNEGKSHNLFVIQIYFITKRPIQWKHHQNLGLLFVYSSPSLVGRSSRYNLSRHVDKKIGDNYMKHVYGDKFDTSYCSKSGSISSIMHDV